eukprot:GCRY01002861.1.p1 GENE.GCRY01002861.1~~GCRY01002861.1.p1  ORF type:complete len:507 (-),score=108.17 GCRY01002861.1:13-1533(-)
MYTVGEALTDQKGLFATENIAPGTTLLKQKPYAVVLSSKCRETHCSFCFKPCDSSILKRCARCKYPKYCSKGCQRDDWAVHKEECLSICARKKTPTDTMRLVARVLNRHAANIEQKNQREVSSITSLMSHTDKLSNERKEELAKIAALIRRFVANRSPEDEGAAGTGELAHTFTVAEVFEIIQKVAVNGHSVCDDELNVLGVGLFPLIAKINHSCAPNCAYIFEGRLMHVRALRHIPSGEELTFSYIETAVPRARRRRELAEGYFFTCNCARCSDEASDRLERVVCPKCAAPLTTSSALLLDQEGQDSADRVLQCGGCKVLVDKAPLVEQEKTCANLITSGQEHVAIGQHLLSSSGSNSSSSSTGAGSTTREALEILFRAFRVRQLLSGPIHYDYVHLGELLILAFLSAQQYSEALTVMKQIAAVYKEAYAYEPQKGLFLAKFAKTLWYCEGEASAQVALCHAEDAHAILSLTHPPSAPCREILSALLGELKACCLQSQIPALQSS